MNFDESQHSNATDKSGVDLAGDPFLASEPDSSPLQVPIEYLGESAPTAKATEHDGSTCAPELSSAPYSRDTSAGDPLPATTVDDAGHGGPPKGSRPLGRGSPPGKSNHRLRNSALGVAAAIVALATGLGLGHVAWTSDSSSVAASSASKSTSSKSGSRSTSTGTSPSSSSSSSTASGSTDVSSIADRVDPGLVDIDTTLGYEDEEAAGTGIVLTSSGEILTNNHVIDGATSISVTDIGNGKTYTATVVGYDTTKDIAVLQLRDASGLQTASIGNSSNVSVGETVVGIGNAGGTGGTPSAAGGTVTALDQSITASDESSGSSEQLTDLIETNADIQAGDSGGSLVDSSGQVIAMDTAASTGSSDSTGGQSSGYQSYAIPINEAISIANEIEAGTSTSTIHIGTTGFLGVETDSNSEAYGASVSGATVAGVVTSSPAQTAGLAAGDTIISVDGLSVDSAEGLTELLEPYAPGDKVTVAWTTTSGLTETATVQLTSGPPQ
jgi:S1-C subfamily serine protease